jgi:DNA-binding HxlR family transcriptional regulator
MALLDLLGRRWALRILWELGEAEEREGIPFRALQSRCGDLSPSVLNTRLKELREAGLVELVEGEGYRATRHAREMRALLLPLDDWAKRWSRRVG